MNGVFPYLNLEYFYYHLYKFLKALSEFIIYPNFEKGFYFWLKVLSLSFSTALAVGVILVVFSILDLRKGEISEIVKSFFEQGFEERLSRWDKIKKYLESENSSDWRRAVIEAESILEKIFKNIGYKGKNLGEILENIEPGRLASLEDLWKAHKIRNRIVHEGMDFDFSKEKAEEVLGIYEKVLKELGYIK